ncbi:hypothetical protein LAZ67_18001540 [Cordylochernes scorpioides]|uniref:Reverse transcriptase domain-containing protein n=1 Tax=Cordylochernes scorpioides TaxID=51811 RepID=A0ABY6LKM1_9ARAC|nr:hypothetical protein LAZ67_18001540 [Cordylochernes scorpioides]
MEHTSKSKKGAGQISSNFTCELTAIWKALDVCLNQPSLHQAEGILIYSNSISALEAIQKGNTKIAQKIHSLLTQLEPLEKNCILQWIPAHNFVYDKIQESKFKFDVVSLYPSLPHDLIVDSLRSFLADSHVDYHTPSKIIELTHLCLQSSVCSFNSQFFLQIKGSPMGNPLSSAAAEIVMRSIDMQITSDFPSDVRLWRRYIDDVFCICTKSQVENILSKLISYHPDLAFTHETETNNALPFLDCLIIRTPTRYHSTERMKRLEEHSKNISRQDEKSAIYQHIRTSNHSFDLANPSVHYSRIYNKQQRLTLEALVSQGFHAINRHIDLPESYQSLFP